MYSHINKSAFVFCKLADFLKILLNINLKNPVIFELSKTSSHWQMDTQIRNALVSTAVDEVIKVIWKLVHSIQIWVSLTLGH